jgi:hypothetical protein
MGRSRIPVGCFFLEADPFAAGRNPETEDGRWSEDRARRREGGGV